MDWLYWLGIIIGIVLTTLFGVLTAFSAFFSGWSLYGTSVRKTWDWLAPALLAFVFLFLTFICINQLSKHPLVITVSAHASTR